MNASRRLLSSILFLIGAAGCGGRHETVAPEGKEPAPRPATVADLLPAGAERVLDLQDAIDKALAAAKTKSKSKSRIRFRSFNGRWIGTDCDADIELHPRKVAVLAEYGFTEQSYDGTYSITEAAELKLSLPKYGGEWPAMQVYRDKADLLLVPSDASVGFIFGNRGGATISGGRGSFWPFRQIPENE